MRIQTCAPACSRICAPLRVAVPKRMGAWLGGTLHVLHCMLHAARFTLHVACCTFYAARCTLQLAAHLQADGLDELAHLPQPEPELGVELHLVLSAEDGLRVQRHAAVPTHARTAPAPAPAPAPARDGHAVLHGCAAPTALASDPIAPSDCADSARALTTARRARAAPAPRPRRCGLAWTRGEQHTQRPL